MSREPGARTVTVAVLTAGLGQPSSTRLLADRLTQAVETRLRQHRTDALIEVVELRPLARALADNLLTGFPPPELEVAVSSVVEADALIAATPVFAASYSGLFKTFFDVLDAETLSGKPTLVAATGGSARHSLVIEHALRPLFTYLRAVVVPTGVFAATEDFGGTADTQPDPDTAPLTERIGRAADELVALLILGPVTDADATSPAPGDGGLEDVTPFEDLLRGGG